MHLYQPQPTLRLPWRRSAARVERIGSRRTRRATILRLLGPAFVAAIAYVDPGNFATNITAGSTFGYALVWVVIASNLMAMLIQYLSAKVGIATGKNLAELCRDHFPKPVSRGLWVQAELVVIATDLAEVLGGAIALQLLFGLPLLTGGVITAVVAFAVLSLHGRTSERPFQVAIIGLLAVILFGFLYALVVGGFEPVAFMSGTVPQFQGADSVLLAAGILGATVMPHAIYLHSGLTQGRPRGNTTDQRNRVLRSQRIDVVVAMSIAGVVNLAMLVTAASVFSSTGPVETLQGAYDGFSAALGPFVALLFAAALLASGIAASSVGTCSGQMVMQGFLRHRVPLVVRRLVTITPAIVVLALGVDPTRALVLSQVVLSFGIPFALVPLVMLTCRRKVMGDMVNRAATTLAAAACATVIIVLNGALVWLTVTG